MRQEKIALSSLVLLLLISPGRLAAQPVAERLLIPVSVTQPIAGAHGSLWTSELVARNMGQTGVLVRHIILDCTFLCGTDGNVSPNETVRLFPSGGTNRNAAIIEVAGAGDLAFNLRVQDVSRQAETWGTEIPVIREHELRTSTIVLVNVPVTDGFRHTLRIYEIDGAPEAQVRVRLYSILPNHVGVGVPPRPDQLLGERVLRLIPPIFPEREPAYLEVGDLSQIALGAAERVLIEIDPLTPGLRYWAFVSVTNNATQHVTTITPR